jgi:hypothetical protein
MVAVLACIHSSQEEKHEKTEEDMKKTRSAERVKGRWGRKDATGTSAGRAG